MKLHTQTHDVERVGVKGESSFSIKTTAQAFDILSSGIYSDPILAVIRELSCNAWDAHKDAGKEDVPFEVHLPNRLEPWFSVIDHGIGLSDEDTRGLYTTYFESTKSNDDSKIGAFGLGSKSPFSYSKAFEVIVRFEGKKRTYSVFLDENGVPTIATLATIDTDEVNGVEVKLAVRREDHGLFREKVAECLQHFPVKPVIKGCADFKFQDRPKGAIEGDGYFAYKSGSWERKVIAVQGNVPYRVDGDQLRKLSPELREFLDEYAVVAFFDIGQLDVAASREEIRYEERTLKNLTELLEKVRIDFLERLDAEISKLTSAGKRWDVYVALSNRFRYTNIVKKIAGSSFKFASPLFNEWLEADGYVDVIPGSFHSIKMYRHGQTRAVPTSWASATRQDKDGKPFRVHVQKPHDGIQVMLNDVTKRSSIRMNHWLEESSDKGTIIAIAPTSDRILKNQGRAVPTAKQRKDDLNAILANLGNPTIINLSEETEDVAVTGTPRKSGNTFKQYVVARGYRRNNDRRKPEYREVDEPTDGGLYVEITQLRDTIVNSKQVNWNDDTFFRRMKVMLTTINYVNGTEYDPNDIYGLTKKVVKYVSGQKDWTSVEDLYKASVVKLKDILEVRNRIQKTEDNYGVSNALMNGHFHKMVDRLPASSHFRTTVEPALKAVEIAQAAAKKGFDSNTALSVLNVNKVFDIDIKVSNKPYFHTKDFVDYPMLKYVSINTNDGSKYNDYQAYIELIEAQ